mmetsp:Transcript_21435/g.55708  ORF Transcript_21435/g.55708 Transcript_21435/m.55708 type:complete len:368 (-) Transcript_21435:8-1111(-)
MYVRELLGSLINAGKHGVEHILLALLHLGNHVADLLVRVLFVLFEDPLQLELFVKILYLLHALGVLLGVVLLQHLSLLGCAPVQCLHNKPRALVVLDVSANFTNNLGGTVAIKVVVLHLEVLSHLHADFLSESEALFVCLANKIKPRRHGEVESVESGLVLHNALVLGNGKLAKVNAVKRSCSEVKHLAKLGFQRNVVEELNKIHVALASLEVLLEHYKDNGLYNKAVVDGISTNTLALVPARLSAASDGFVHDIVSNQEEALEKFNAPSDHVGFQLQLSSHLRDERLYCSEHSHATVELSSWNSVLKHLADTLLRLLWKLVAVKSRVEKVCKLSPHCKEGLPLLLFSPLCGSSGGIFSLSLFSTHD